MSKQTGKKSSPIQVGDRFGHLTVVAAAESTPSGQKRWRCLCDCGQEKLVMDSNLKRGRTSSCGCKRQKDLEGMHIGRLTVLERSDRYSSRGNHQVRLWKCRCDCGAITYKATDVLTNENISMCQQCAKLYGMGRAREAAGFAYGTQLSKLEPSKEQSHNSAGVRGVYLDRKTGKYRARIRFQGRMYNLGTFVTVEEALAARKEGEERYFKTFLESIQESS